MIRLSADQYCSVRPLIASLSHIGSLFAVLDGTISGEIFADRVSNPRSVFVVTPDGLILAGDPDNYPFNHEIGCYFTSRHIPRAVSSGSHSYEFFCDNDWAKTLYGIILRGLLPMKHTIHYYVWGGSFNKNWRSEVPKDMTMFRIDREFLLHRDRRNFSEVAERIEEWTSEKDFLEIGFGFCLVCGDIIVSRCIADCVTESACEIGVGTDPEYRQMGLAKLTVTAAIEYCLARGLKTIGWHASDTNLASQKTAERAGFIRMASYTGYYGCYRQADHFLEYGFYCLLVLKQPDLALEYFEKSCDLKPLSQRRIAQITAKFVEQGQPLLAEKWTGYLHKKNTEKLGFT